MRIPLHAKEHSPVPPTLLALPLIFLYDECVFRLAIGAPFFNRGLLYMVLFCVACGLLSYALVSLIRRPLVRCIVTVSLLGLASLSFLIEYFVFRYFGVLFDVNTITSGAGDAVGTFSGEIFRLIFSWNGLLICLLYVLPPVAFLLLRRWLYPQPIAPRRLVALLCALTLTVCGTLGLSLDRLYGSLCTSQYNFSSVSHSLGLHTGLVLDVAHRFTGLSQPAFTLPQEENSATSLPAEEEAPPAPVDYPYNVLNIDFDALSGSATAQQKELDSYVQSLTPTRQNAYTGLFKGKNLIFLSAEAFTAELIDPVLTPTLYRLATKGIQFTDYYQPSSAGTTGGEYQNLFGLLPNAGGKSFKNTASTFNYFTIGSQLNRLGYYGKAYHNNSYTYYDRNKTHINLGYSDGYMGYGNGMEAFVKNRWPQSDLEMLQGTLPTYIGKQPFNIYYMTVSGHSNYTREGNSMVGKNWDRVTQLTCSDRLKGYFAANLELEDALTYLVTTLEEAGIADDTVICLGADHFPYGLDVDGSLGNMPFLEELYGYPVTTTWQRDHNRLILWSGCLEDDPPIVVDTPTSSLDILPTLSNLFGTAFDSRLMPGRDVFSEAEALVFDLQHNWKTTLGTYAATTGTFTPTDPDTPIPEGYVSRIRSVVSNKIEYSDAVPKTDYFRYLFGGA